MRKWLRMKYEQLVHKVKLWIYRGCLFILRKLRIYHTANITSKANGKEGTWWNDRLILKITPDQGNMYKVLYCVPGVDFGMAVVDMDDLVAGVAELPINFSRPRIKTTLAQLKEQEKHHSWTGGVQTIGTLGLPASPEPMEKLYHSGRQHEAIKEEIRMEYQEKLKAEEPRKDTEGDMYR